MDWIEGFIEQTAHVPSPDLFRKWAAISSIAGALERKVWVRTMGSNLYPNIYVILVAPPGVGKTEVTWRVRDMWAALKGHHIAPSSVTKASLMDELDDAKRSVTRPDQVPAVLTYNSLLISINELGVLIPQYENEFMNVLTDLYDGKPYSERRRTRNVEIKIERPHLNILAACTPAYLTQTLPEGAWDQGFTSRVILIYSGERTIRSLFAETVHDQALYVALQERLAAIGEVSGQFSFSAEAATLMEAWHLAGGAPQPDHPKLYHYNTRRTAHVLKLCMVASMSENLDLVIEERHVVRALDWLTEAELHMPDIFKAMANTSHAQLIEETFHFVLGAWSKAGKKPVNESRVINFLSLRTPAHNVNRVLEVMVHGGLMRKEIAATHVGYVPIQKEKP